MFSKLLTEASQLPHVCAASTQEFQKHSALLLQHVNDTLSRHPNILEITGNTKHQTMLDNHMYHAKFMLTVLYFNNYPLLCRVLVWFYRTYQSRGYSDSYFPILFAAWQRAIDRHLPPTAAEEIILKYQWLMAKHNTLLQLAQNTTAFSFSDFGLDDSLTDEILTSCRESLLNGDYHSCLALSSADTPEEIARLYCCILQPCLYSIGSLWEQDEISAAQEHLATATVARIMQMQYSKISSFNKHMKGPALITAAPGEYHSLGANMASDLLELDNWQTYFLGGNTPIPDLLTLLHEKKPFLLGVAVVLPFNLIKVHDLIKAIRCDQHLSRIRILIGGPAFFLDHTLCQQLGADGYATDSQSAVTLADAWWQARQSEENS
ncbi:cobalamin B12-binding domain-containing protein [Azotosporobacter soli]|uniref:cobalamin B12-binding domain-containing protein n=1 Tax=Azotosporobacter soli TaxID=3055040 RepID=UPI0031FE8CBD